MANYQSVTEAYESLPKWAKIVLQIFFGYFIAIVYRVIRYLEAKNTSTLIAGLVCIIPFVAFVVWIVDIITEVMDNKIRIFAD